MEARVSEVLENVLGLLALEGSFEVVENPEEVVVSIEASDPGRLIGYRGETLDCLQLIVNQIANRNAKPDQFKRVVVDVSDWRKNKEGDLERRAKDWAQEVLETKSPLELEPMPAWQRRIVHLAIEQVEGVESESVSEGRDRHLIIKPAVMQPSTVKPAETNKRASKKSSK